MSKHPNRQSWRTYWRSFFKMRDGARSAKRGLRLLRATRGLEITTSVSSIPRERALMQVIATRYPNWRDLTIHESSPCNRGTSIKLAQQCRFYTASQYDPQLGFGNTHPNAGYRSENLEKQTFPDGAFDLVVTQDVFEHVFDTPSAFRELHARLGPAGLISLRLH
jgi:SAM-dependent methyltransferase